MLKILHIVNVDKFIDLQIPRYFDLGHENEIIYLGNEFSYNGIYSNVIRWVKPFSQELDDLAQRASEFNIVIVYLLDYEKATFINKLDKNVKVIWHFFGGEIYGNLKDPDEVYSKKTRKLLDKESNSLEKIRTKISSIKAALRYKFNKQLDRASVVASAMKRANYFLWYDQNEYNILKGKLPYLPEFLLLPITNKFPMIDLNLEKDSIMLLGNSCSPENNHIDVMLQIHDTMFQGLILIPLSYGSSLFYKENLIKCVKNTNLKYEILDEFLPYQQYISLISKCSTAVFNSYRQMALGNILILLVNGVKLYISERNPSYLLMKNWGFHVESIERKFKEDVLNNDISLSQELRFFNRDKFYELIDPNNLIVFNEQLLNIGKYKAD